MKNSEATETAATFAEQGAHVAPEKASSKESASKKKAKTDKPGRTKEASTPRAESKGAKILALIGRPKGATLNEIMKATGWQPHSVRGFLSLAAKKHKLNIESAKNDAGERTYSIAR